MYLFKVNLSKRAVELLALPDLAPGLLQLHTELGREVRQRPRPCPCPCPRAKPLGTSAA